MRKMWVCTKSGGALFVAEHVRIPGVGLRCREGTVNSSTLIDHHLKSHPINVVRFEQGAIMFSASWRPR